MATRFARVDLSDNARDFQPIALEPGLPMLDKSGTNAKILYKWLDCLVAEPEWEGDAVNFYLRDKSGGRLEAVPCWPATTKRLQGPLKADLDEIEERVRAARPKSATERLVHKGLSQALRSLKSDPNRADLGCYLFEYRDVDRNPRLVWCWGFQRVDGQDASAAVCPNSGCNLLFVMRPGGSSKCPNCHRPVVRKPLPWKRIAAVTALLLLLGVVGWLWWSTRPSAVLAGQVVSVADTSRAHVYHKKREMLDQRGRALAVLDVDATQGNGPETITIKRLVPNMTCEYLVHHHEGKGKSNTTLAASDALVRLYMSDKDYCFVKPKNGGWPTR